MTQEEALAILKCGYNVFITGAAGSGKTYLLKKYIEYLRTHGVGVGVTASTGIAATHLDGTTIHSWSGLGIKDNLTEDDLKKLSRKPYLKERFKKTHVLIIDEISMLSQEQFESLDLICQKLKKNEGPFGGMQIILCGDFFQLPPVGKEDSFVCESELWQTANFKVCYLEEQYRHLDKKFITLLESVRKNEVVGQTLELLKKALTKEEKVSDKVTKLYTHNANVDEINNKELEAMPGKAISYTMTGYGDEHLVKNLKNSCLAGEELTLKKGALVMFLKNNFDLGYVNGTLGTVSECEPGMNPIVLTKDGRYITVPLASWEIEDELGKEVLAMVQQYPLRLAWAITVHKSQGMTLDEALIDLSRSFTPGMGYVALSRVRTLEGLHLLGFNDVALKVSNKAIKLDKVFFEQSQKLQKEILKTDNYKNRQKEYLDWLQTFSEA
ncbi:MAG TPA: PIF1 family DEAD/DEAH box helicase [Candidatus Paceibacterota bacterium]|nr:PIF1 family DEAD/DEAH box helicase [Candidatus Paceibacterota bacterium]